MADMFDFKEDYTYLVMFQDCVKEIYNDEATAISKMEYYCDWYLRSMPNETEEYKQEYKQMWHVEKVRFLMDAIDEYMKGS